MRTVSRMIGAALLAAASAASLAAGESYLLQVGRLYAGVEFPRMSKDYCTTAKPSMAKAISAQYVSWSERNAVFLSRAREQFARADERLKADGASLSQTDASIIRRIKGLDSGKFCQAYADVLKAKEKEFGAELGELLAAVESADAELTSRSSPR